MTILETNLAGLTDKHLVAVHTLDIRAEQLVAGIMACLANSKLLHPLYGTGKLMGGKLDVLDAGVIRMDFSTPDKQNGETLHLTEINRDGTITLSGQQTGISWLEGDELQQFAIALTKSLKFLSLQMEIG